MKLVNGKYGFSIEFKENQVQNLIIENPTAMSEIVGELYSQAQGGEGNFVLQEKGKELKMSKVVDCILEPFSFSINNKKYLTRLYADMALYCNDSEYELKSYVVENLIKLADNIGIASMYDIVFDLDITPEVLFKTINVRFNEEYMSLKEKIIQYISIVSSLNIISLIVFVNFKGYLQKEELKEIYMAAFYNKLPLLMIESEYKELGLQENGCILDKDLCIIDV